VVGDEATTMNEDVGGMDDFEVIAERQRIMANLAVLTDRYRELNREIGKRETLKWMTAPR
jgi:hypothetical protein